MLRLALVLVAFSGCVLGRAPSYFVFPVGSPGVMVEQRQVAPLPVPAPAIPQPVEPPDFEAPPLVAVPPVASAAVHSSSPCPSGAECPSASATASAAVAIANAEVHPFDPGAAALCPSFGGAGAASMASGSASASATASVSLGVCTEFFGVPLAGSSDVIFLLDRSYSMAETANFGDQSQQPGAPARVDGVAIGVPSWQSGPLLPDKLTVAKRELLKVIDNLPDGTRFAIGFFDDGLTWFAPELRPLNAQTRGEVHRFAATVHPSGATAAVPALEAAFVFGPKRVVLLSDGMPNFEGSSEQLLTMARAQIKTGVRFDTVSVGFEQNGSLMAGLARESGGVIASY